MKFNQLQIRVLAKRYRLLVLMGVFLSLSVLNLLILYFTIYSYIFHYSENN